jgi:hypothetical protein
LATERETDSLKIAGNQNRIHPNIFLFQTTSGAVPKAFWAVQFPKRSLACSGKLTRLGFEKRWKTGRSRAMLKNRIGQWLGFSISVGGWHSPFPKPVRGRLTTRLVRISREMLLMDKVIRIFETHDEAELAGQEDDARLTTSQRLANFLEMMAPVYGPTEGLQRIYRTRDFDEPEVRDRWRLGL